MDSLTPDSKCIFYHVPKTGGSTIYEVTRDWKNFKRAVSNKNHVQVSWNPPRMGHVGVAVVRDPYDRFISAFYHLVDCCNEEFYYKKAQVSDCVTLKKLGVKDFGEYFNNDPNVFLTLLEQGDKVAKKTFNKFDIFRPQYYWLKSQFGGIHSGIKVIINQKQLQQQFEDLADKINEQCDWNKSVNQRITNMGVSLNMESKKIIQKLYKNDFKYLFPELLDSRKYGITGQQTETII